EDPDLDADRAVGRLGRAGGVIDVGPERVERPPPLPKALGPRGLGPPQAPGDPDLDSLRADPHGALHRALHGPPERNALLQLVRDVVADQLRGELGPLDLLDVDRGFLPSELRQLVPELVHLGPPLPDHDARAAGVYRHAHLTG